MRIRAIVDRSAVVVRQAVRLARRTTAAGCVLVAAGAAFAVAAYLVLAATSVSPAQQRDRDFGVFSAFAGYGAVQLPPGDDATTRRLAAELGASGADRFMVSLTAVEFYVAGLARSETRYEEHPWLPNPFPGRYHLTGGRWPAAAGEVALTASPSVRVGTTLGISGGRVRLTVVGLVRDDYNPGPAVLAAPGTWRSLDRGLAEQFTTVRAQPTAYWSGGQDVLRRVEDLLAGSPGQQPAAEIRRVVRDSHRTAPADGERETPWLDRVPAGYTIPSILLPVLTTGLAFAIAGRRLRGLRTVGDALGVPRFVLLGGLGLALSVSLFLAVPVGALAGKGIVELLEPALERLGGKPVDLRVDLAGPVLRYLGLTALTALVASAVVILRGSRRPAQAAPGARRAGGGGSGGSGGGSWWRLRLDEARRLLALLALCAGGLQLPAVDSPATATIAAATVTVAALVMLPDLLRFSLRLLPESRWEPRLVRRRIQAHPGAATAMVATLSIVLAMTLGYLTLLTSWLAAAEAQRLPEASAGQVMVAGRESNLFRPPANSLQVVEQSVPDRASVREMDLAWTVALAANGDTVRQAQVSGTSQPLLVVPDRAAVAALLGRPLTPTESAVLDQQGILAWSGGDVPGEPGCVLTAGLGVVDADGNPQSTQVSVPMALTSAASTSWQAATTGVVEQRTADAFGLPHVVGARLYTQVPETGIAKLRRDIAASGIDPETVMTHEAPPPLVPALALPGTAVALTLLLVAVVTSTTWIGAGTLRRFTRLLTCLGISPRKARTTVLVQHAFLFGNAFAVGLPLAALPVATTVIALPAYDLNIPWLEILSLGGAVVGAGLASLALAVARLRATAFGQID